MDIPEHPDRDANMVRHDVSSEDHLSARMRLGWG